MPSLLSSVVVVFVCVVVSWYLASRHQYQVLPVERLEWSSQQPFAADIITRSLPIVLTNTHLSKWKASKWTPDELGRQQSSIRDTQPLLMVRSSTDRHFRFTNLQRSYMKGSLAASFQPLSTTLNMTLPAFIDAVQRPKPRTSDTRSSDSGSSNGAEYLYFSDGVGVIATRTMDLLPEANMLSPSGDIEDCDTNIWIGQPDVVAMPHYDSSYNMFVQIYGRKRFLLAPPSAFTHTGMYPSLHPYFRQAAVDIYNDTLEPLPSQQPAASLASLTGQSVPIIYEVTLNPGDVLYLPPFWLHRVTSLDVSISVNAWCPCPEFGLINRVTDVAVPFEAEWNDATIRTAVRRLITMVLDRVAMKVKIPSRPSLQSLTFMNQLVNMRYIMTKLVASQPSCPATTDKIAWQSLCGPLQSTIRSSSDIALGKTIPPLANALEDESVASILDAPLLIHKFQERAFEIAYHFTGSQPLAAAGAPLFLDDDVRIISIGNWIETLVAWTVGNEPKDVAQFLHCCWRV